MLISLCMVCVLLIICGTFFGILLWLINTVEKADIDNTERNNS